MPEPRPGTTPVSEEWPEGGNGFLPRRPWPRPQTVQTFLPGSRDQELFPDRRTARGRERRPRVQETQGQSKQTRKKKSREGVRGPDKPRHIKEGGSREREKMGRLTSGQAARRGAASGAGQVRDLRPSRCGLKPRPHLPRRPAEEARRPRPPPAHRPQRPLTRPPRPTLPGRGGAPRPTRRRHRGLGARRQPPTAAPLRRQPLRRLRGTRGGAGSRRVRPEERRPAPALRAPLLPRAPCRPEDRARRAQKLPLPPRGVAMAQGCDATHPGSLALTSGGEDNWSRAAKVGFMGNTCTPVAGSCQCMAKPIQYCKVISLQLK